MSIFDKVKQFFASSSGAKQPVKEVPVTEQPVQEQQKIPLVTIEKVLTVQPEPVETVSVSPAKDWPSIVATPEPVREEVKASAPAAWPFPVGAPPVEAKPKARKPTAAPKEKQKVTPAKATVEQTKKPAAIKAKGKKK